uniref:Obg domain-containing protein n=1 Tax=Spongospora subterranea TaxID=70186 RepID=A0A0H5QFL3_9EUKA|eukprot:CRZ00745.1 hypothetical protein [Spongospora subterranea]
MLRSITRGWARAIQSEAFTATQNRFIDFARITVTGGAGGQGCSSFERLRNGKRGRANGGNGGSGGDVIIKSSSSAIGLNISSHHIKGQCGMNGGSDKSHGQNGNDAIITVPVGTVIRFVESSSGRLAHSNSNDWMDMFADPIQHDPSSESEFESENADCSDEDESRETPEAGAVIKDMMRHGDEVVVATGGRGGMGNRASNARYIKGVHQTPSSGTKGTTARIELELKLLADVGLVGYPNAGKSTLLSALCNATPKIG